MYIRCLGMRVTLSTASLQQIHKYGGVSAFSCSNRSNDLQRMLFRKSSAQPPWLLRGSLDHRCHASTSEPDGSEPTTKPPEANIQKQSVNGKLGVYHAKRSKDHGSYSAPFHSLVGEPEPYDQWKFDVDTQRRIFCNRSLNMRSIVAVGFDMDYTLAQYRADTFETRAYHGTVKKLVFDLGYPHELLDWKFDCHFMVRGLVVDKKRGNVLKMDRHKYVKVAYHGFQEMSHDDRLATYCNTLVRESYDEPDYALIDTLFSLAEAYLFAQLVEYRDSHSSKFPPDSDYSSIYRDVRAAIDLCHRDGTLKQAVAQDPAEYIHYDPELIPMLKMLRSSGRMTFLVTNSLWDYTNVVMNYLFGNCGTNAELPRDNKWLEFFDMVVTGSAKPGFFADGNRAPIYEVDISTGMLQNTDNGSPLAQIGQSSSGHGFSASTKETKQACKVFQGGNVGHLHRLLAIEAGSQVLYVGDHIYGDILRSKKELGWRTMLVVPELAKELQLVDETVSLRKEIRSLRNQREALEDKIQRLYWSLRFEQLSPAEYDKVKMEIKMFEDQKDKIRELHRHAQRHCHQKFHKTWGQLMKTGYQNSRFAHQVERFACLYTSQVTNLCYYSPDKSYRTKEDNMPHEWEERDV
ncbi:hypothetical protein KP509_30G057200 [Ceratopteris richardii]|uniref:Uncharacterized protein n=1 Tax=Ceratopteris richardii TaxID=49495 RepID=A0A8T2R487_CERRI|nr:hypothetical protein KP509_30G057200 [Ceratopteris richardii]